MNLKNNRIYMYFLDYLKGSSRLEAKNCMYRILMAGKYHNVGYFKYWLYGPFHNAYHARPFIGLKSCYSNSTMFQCNRSQVELQIQKPLTVNFKVRHSQKFQLIVSCFLGTQLTQRNLK